jgi:hypothetical protein
VTENGAGFPARRSCAEYAAFGASKVSRASRIAAHKPRVTQTESAGTAARHASLTVARRSSKLLVSTGRWIRRSAPATINKPFAPAQRDPRVKRPAQPGQFRRQFVAETHFSAACAAPTQEAWLSQAHEIPRWTESSCRTPQKRAPQPHARLTARRGWIFRALFA